MDFAEFHLIEETFPMWTQARLTVSRAVPECLRFVSNDNSTVMLANDWALPIFEACPTFIVWQCQSFVSEAVNLALSYIECLSKYLGYPITQQLFAVMNCAIQEFDQMHRAEGSPTSIDVLKHYLGISDVTRPMSMFLSARQRNSADDLPALDEPFHFKVL